MSTKMHHKKDKKKLDANQPLHSIKKEILNTISISSTVNALNKKKYLKFKQ